jgi:hypothetical protein
VKKIIAVCFLIGLILSFQAFAPHNDEKPQNLKVLSKKISMDSLDKLMKVYAKSLGVRCGFCHAVVPDSKPMKLDFASDAKVEKKIARAMIKMTDKINHKYIDKMPWGPMRQVTCVSCHNGNIRPIVSVDSLPKKKF